MGTETNAAAQLVNALPYVDRGFEEAGVREAALGMVEEEMRRYRPTKTYLDQLPPLSLKRFETDLLRAEFERIGSRQPPEHMSMKRYELPPPPPGRLTDVQSWRDAVDNSKAQLEHQSVRIQNLQLLLAHGSDAWRCHNDNLVRMVTATERRLQATRKAIQEVNLQRKTEQLLAGERLHTLEDTWVHLVMKNYELEREIADLEAAVRSAEAELPQPPAAAVAAASSSPPPTLPATPPAAADADAASPASDPAATEAASPPEAAPATPPAAADEAASSSPPQPPFEQEAVAASSSDSPQPSPPATPPVLSEQPEQPEMTD